MWDPCGTLVVEDRESAVKEQRSVLIAELCSWFAREARDLPWRRRRSGYHALVAEAMLQQTQVSRVVERYTAFIKRFPTIRQLADADEQEVLTMWQGLGYYRRARHLHAAANVIVSDHGGRVPRLTRTLRQLPGWGGIPRRRSRRLFMVVANRSWTAMFSGCWPDGTPGTIRRRIRRRSRGPGRVLQNLLLRRLSRARSMRR